MAPRTKHPFSLFREKSAGERSVAAAAPRGEAHLHTTTYLAWFFMDANRATPFFFP